MKNVRFQVRDVYFILSATSASSNDITATADDLRKLDIYGDLVSMPKGTETEQDHGSENPLPSEGTTMGKQVSKKELGRLRSKQAVLAKIQASGEDMNNISRNDTEEPQTKKTRSEQGNGSSEGIDVVMADE